MSGHQGAPLPALRGPDQGTVQRLGRIAPAPELDARSSSRPRGPDPRSSNRPMTPTGPWSSCSIRKVAARVGSCPATARTKSSASRARIGMRHAQGHPRDVRIIGQGGQTADSPAGSGCTQHQTPRLETGEVSITHIGVAFDHAASLEGSGGSRRGNANGEPGDPDSPRKTSLVRIGCCGEQRDPDVIQSRVTRRPSPVVVVGRKNRHVTTAVGLLGEFHGTVWRWRTGCGRGPGRRCHRGGRWCRADAR